jgi:hypothetical protein
MPIMRRLSLKIQPMTKLVGQTREFTTTQSINIAAVRSQKGA